MVYVYGSNELLDALKRKEDEICIQGDYCSEICQTVGNRTRDANFQGISGGQVMISAGTSIFAYLIESVINIVTRVPRETALLEKGLGLYSLAGMRRDEIKLRLRQLDY